MKQLLTYLLIALTCLGCKKNTSVTTPPPALSPDSAAVTVTLKSPLPAVLHESSGLCYTDGNLWTFGDSGNLNGIYKIDTATGVVLQIVIVQNFSNTDWEDITADSSYIYVGDFGNNNGDRKDLKIIRIKKSDLNNSSSQLSINADAINFSYADQTDFTPNSNNNFDCEALASIGDSLYIFTKDGGDLQTRCYRLPKDTGTYSVSPISTFNSQGKITSAAYNPATKELALGGYMNKKIFPFIWFFKNYNDHNFFTGNKIREALTTNDTPWQTEGINYISTNRMFLSCESTPEIPASLYTLQLNFSY